MNNSSATGVMHTALTVVEWGVANAREFTGWLATVGLVAAAWLQLPGFAANWWLLAPLTVVVAAQTWSLTHLSCADWWCRHAWAAAATVWLFRAILVWFAADDTVSKLTAATIALPRGGIAWACFAAYWRRRIVESNGW